MTRTLTNTPRFTNTTPFYRGQPHSPVAAAQLPGRWALNVTTLTPKIARAKILYCIQVSHQRLLCFKSWSDRGGEGVGGGRGGVEGGGDNLHYDHDWSCACAWLLQFHLPAIWTGTELDVWRHHHHSVCLDAYKSRASGVSECWEWCQKDAQWNASCAQSYSGAKLSRAEPSRAERGLRLAVS